MNTQRMFCAIATAVLAGGLPGTAAADKADLGKREYFNSCVVCHGADLKSGAYVDFLKTAPPDLTQLSKKNGGVFPFERVYRVIDGREMVKGHGARDMPIWGNRFSVEAAPAYDEYPFNTEVFVRGRILALIDYLNRMQSK